MATSKRFRWLAVGALACVPPLAATAQEARAAKTINLRAGPAQDYPLVTRVGAGTPLAVQGCVSGYSWCDVIAGPGLRGWVFAGNIVYPYQSNAVPVIQYGALIGLPIIAFALDGYWGSYYRDRPWYGNRSRWEQHAPPGPGFRPGPGYRPGGPGYRPPSGGPGTPIARPPPGRPFPPGGRPDSGRPGNGGRGPDVRPGGGAPAAPQAGRIESDPGSHGTVDFGRGGRGPGGGGERGGGERGGGGRGGDHERR